MTLCLVLACAVPAWAGPTKPAEAQASDADFVPPGATDVLNQRDGGVLTVDYSTQMAPSDLVDFYRPVLEKAGWRFTYDTRAGLARTYSLAKGDKGEGSLILEPKRGTTSVVLNLKE